MARIRSVHPGLFTDEGFAFLSDAAQVLLIGLWTECDDQGAFEWKPGMLRMRLRPGKDGAIEPLLEELEQANCIKGYEHGGRRFGVVRNFKRFQRPKKPNSVHFIPPEFRTYVGSSSDSSEPKAPIDQHSSEPDEVERSRVRKKREPTGGEAKAVPKKGEKSQQMEDGGGIGEVVARARDPDFDLERQLREAAGWQSEPSPKLAVTGEIQALIDNGADLHLDVLPTVKAIAAHADGRSWSYFVKAIARARDRRFAAGSLKTTDTPAAGNHHGPHRQPPARDTFAVLEQSLAEQRARAAGQAGGGPASGEDHRDALPGVRKGSA